MSEAMYGQAVRGMVWSSKAGKVRRSRAWRGRAIQGKQGVR